MGSRLSRRQAFGMVSGGSTLCGPRHSLDWDPDLNKRIKIIERGVIHTSLPVCKCNVASQPSSCSAMAMPFVPRWNIFPWARRKLSSSDCFLSGHVFCHSRRKPANNVPEAGFPINIISTNPGGNNKHGKWLMTAAESSAFTQTKDTSYFVCDKLTTLIL